MRDYSVDLSRDGKLLGFTLLDSPEYKPRYPEHLSTLVILRRVLIETAHEPACYPYPALPEPAPLRLPEQPPAPVKPTSRLPAVETVVTVVPPSQTRRKLRGRVIDTILSRSPQAAPRTSGKQSKQTKRPPIG